MVYKSLIKPQSFLGKLKLSCVVSFSYLQFDSKYDCLCLHIKLCVLDSIPAPRSGSYHPPRDNKSRSEHQTLFLARVRGSGHETNSGGQLDWCLVQVCTLASWSASRLANHIRLLAKFLHPCNTWVYLAEFLDYSLSS